METTALRFHEYGDPHDILRHEKISVQPPGTGQVLLRLLASPINPADLGSIRGTYAAAPTPPAVGGREGVGEVVEIGPGTEGLATGQRVLLPYESGCWRKHMVADAAALIPVPDSVPLEQAAMATINPPTAWLMLENLVELQPGDWIIQNAANSGVGHCVVQLCRQRGWRTINLVRHPDWIARLKADGADEVFLADDPDLVEKVREVTGDRPPRLGLNSVGGKSAITVIQCLGEGGTLVTSGGMTNEPIRFPTGPLVFNDVRLAGFWLHRWRARNSMDAFNLNAAVED